MMLTSSPLDFHLPGYNRIEDEEENEVNNDSRNSDNEDIHEQIKAQSIQLNKLIKMVE